MGLISSCLKEKTITRLIQIGSNKNNEDLPDNTVTNTKYTILNYIPKSLYEQFSLHMNQYFLLLAFLQLWPLVTPVNPITTWIPLSLIVGLGIMKETADDLLRFWRDRESNNMECTIIEKKKEKKVKSRELLVGNIVKVKENEQIRADMVLLESSDSEGIAYIETSNIDGETDYKQRRTIKETQKGDYLNGIIECEHPNDEIYIFDSNIKLKDQKKYSISSQQLLLQGTILKNTEWVIGCVVYTGNETKIGKNKQKLEIKWTRSDEFLNRVVIFIFLFQLTFMITFGTIGNVLRYFYQNEKIVFYFGNLPMLWYEIIVIPIRYLLLCSLLIPQSLKITTDISKHVLSNFITSDIKLYDEKMNINAISQNTAICEDLGAIEFLFTDKTGTLTENQMIFKKLSVGSTIYTQDNNISKEIFYNDKLLLFLKNLVLCNSVSASITEENQIIYKSSSPDERALVDAAKNYGMILKSRNMKSITIQYFEKEESYDILKILEFTSDRKRMSIVLRDQETKEIIVFSKGADEVMIPTLKGDFDEINDLKRNLKQFASEGLRTLCMGYKKIDEEYYSKWEKELLEIENEIHERNKKKNLIYKELENEFLVLGSSGIEDSLQENVPETIEALRQAGIVVWMLTGDKLETAIQIGHSCLLIPQNQGSIVIIKGETSEEIENSLKGCIEERYYCIVIEGSILTKVLEYQEELFAKVAQKSISVIGCRMTPIQKGKLVDLMKRYTKKRTLAIGDGANDLIMIKEANIGVGIHGKEGLQAARSSDFSIARFKYLKRLLFVHGRNSNLRLAYISQYTIYKSVIIAFSQLIFSFFSSFSGAPILTSFSLLVYNTLLTSILPITYLFNKDFSDNTLENLPQLYSDSQKSRYINSKTFLAWFLFGVYHAIVISLVTYFTFTGDYYLENGRVMDYWKIGLIFLSSVMSIQIFVMLSTLNLLNFVNINFIIISILNFFGVMFIYGCIPIFSLDSLFFGIVHLMM